MMTLTIEQSRVWERSSNFRATIKQAGEKLFAAGMELLASVKREENDKLTAIWSAPDADEFASKIQQVTPSRDAKLIEETIEAFTPDEKLAEKVSKVVADNRKAKQELRELAKKI